MLLLLELALAETVARHFRSFSLLCHPDKRGQKVYFKMLVEARSILFLLVNQVINHNAAYAVVIVFWEKSRLNLDFV